MTTQTFSRRTFGLGVLAAGAAFALPIREVRAAPLGTVTELAVWGDSMAQVWPNYLATLTRLPVYRGAVGGQTIAEIAARFAAWTRPGVGHIVWGGHTDANRQNDTLDDVVPAMAGMAQQAAAQGSRFMPLGLTNGPESILGTDLYAAMILGVNAELQAAHPDYTDVRAHLVVAGLAAARLDPNQQDFLDIGNDIPPASLRTTIGNPAHLNTPGRNVVAEKVDQRIRAKGWLV